MKENIMNNLEIIIRYLNISREELSIKFGQEKSYYRKCQNTGVTPNLDFIVKVCQYCNIKIDDLINKRLELKLEFKGGEVQRK